MSRPGLRGAVSLVIGLMTLLFAQADFAAADATTPPGPLGPACEEMEAVAAASPVQPGPVSWPDVTSGTPANGDLVGMAFGPGERTNLLIIPLNGDPLDRITAWPTTSLVIAQPQVRGDGAALALSFYFHNGCADVLVLSADGVTARRPFRQRVPEAVMGPAWSPDGTLLAVEGMFGKDDAGTLLSVPGSVWTWEPATDTIRDLGRPCEGCSLYDSGLAWSPDGSRLAVPYTGGMCPRFLHTPADPPMGSPEPTFMPGCWSPGIALVDRAGEWRSVSTRPDIIAGGYLNMVGWLDDHTVVLENGLGAGIRLDVDDGSWTPIQFPAGAPVLSPDRHLAAVVDGDGGRWWLDVVDLATGGITRIDVAAEPRVVWAPDSTMIALNLLLDDASQRGAYLVPADGSTPPRLLREGSFGDLAWLPLRDADRTQR